MTPTARVPRVASVRWLNLTAGVLLTVAAGLWLWPIDTTQPPRTGASASKTLELAWPAALDAESTGPGSAQTSAARAQRVIASNVFSASRKAPTTRFVVPGQAVMSASTDTAADMSEMIDPDAEQFPRLSGIVMMNGERRALLQLTADDGAPRLYRAGDQHAGMRVLRIESTHVVLTSRSGTRTLRLSDQMPRDSAEKSP